VIGYDENAQKTHIVVLKNLTTLIGPYFVFNEEKEEEMLKTVKKALKDVKISLEESFKLEDY
jgi:branched-subunit amino acid transport protein AzlD